MTGTKTKEREEGKGVKGYHACPTGAGHAVVN